MNRVLVALFQKEDGGSIFNIPFIYLSATLVLAYVMLKEFSEGVVYIKHSESIPLNSTAAYLAIAIQLFFCIVAAIVCIVKVKRNMQR